MDEDEDESHKCPYCSSSDSCPHVLLVVDKTFRIAEGGALMDAFNDRWSKLCDEGGDDFDESEPFAELLEEVDCYANSSADFDISGGPGRSSGYVIFYVVSADKAQEVLTRFASQG